MSDELSIRFENNWYIDQNDNRWSATRYNEDEADSLSRTLKGCRECINCQDCVNCNHCRECSDCRYCSKCSYCSECSYCDGCIDCRYCHLCGASAHCICCHTCENCAHCKYCHNCYNFYKNPQRIVGRSISSEECAPVVYWIVKGEEQCLVEGFRGTLDELEAHAVEVYTNNLKHLSKYLEFIKGVRAYQESCNDADVL